MDPWVRYSVTIYLGLLLSGTLAATPPVEVRQADLPALLPGTHPWPAADIHTRQPPPQDDPAWWDLDEATWEEPTAAPR